MDLDNLSLNKQWLDFFQRRVAENLALVEHFMSCRTPVAVWSVYTNFLQRAAEFLDPDTQYTKAEMIEWCASWIAIYDKL